MLELGLCMTIKDEANCIGRCLNNIVDLFSQIVILDTGSTDDSQQILQDQYGIDPLSVQLTEKSCYSLAEARNYGFSLLKTPWILSLDADEVISREELIIFLNHPQDSSISGYFCRWDNYDQEGNSFEDYKLFFFRKGMLKRGLIHDNVQLDIRDKQLHATWFNSIVVKHYPEAKKTAHKRSLYLQRLLCAIQKEPYWYRSYWFLGYTYYQLGNIDKALHYLSIISDTHSHFFPVECLNSKMVIAEIYAQLQLEDQLRKTLQDALNFHDQVADDFEVKINFRMHNWLEIAFHHCQVGNLTQIKAYRFAC
jgi:glycosyltransferase involved in cell wall biosynthesis